MRQLIYLFSILLYFSCSNENTSRKTKDMVSESSLDYTDAPLVNSFEKLTTQKLITYYDLLNLKQQHPEFKKDILIQLKDLSKDAIIDKFSLKNSYIKNIHQVGNNVVINDSVKKIRLAYKIISESREISDSIYAYIHSNIIFINREKVVANKIKFSKN